MKATTKRDVRPELNPYAQVVPQVMANNAEDFLLMSRYLLELGYDEINWNLGCPYPMVANRALGAGMLDKPDLLYSILDEVIPLLDARIGLKMRMGYEDTSAIVELLPKLNGYPLSEIIVHARYAKQLYNGGCDLDRFAESVALCEHLLVYNGDINTVEEFQALAEHFPEQRHWMLGRGLVANPFLPERIKANATEMPSDWLERFEDFHACLFDSVLGEAQNHGQAIIKMKHYWEYFAHTVPGGRKIYKGVKKARSLEQFYTVTSMAAHV